MTQVDSMAKARAAKAAKLAAEKLKQAAAKVETEITPLRTSAISDEVVWCNAFNAAMHTFQVKSANDIVRCIPVADAALTAFKVKFK